MICPKCGFEQPDGPECLRCGIVFAKYHGPAVEPPSAVPPPPPPPPGAAAPEAPVEETLYPLAPERSPDPHPPLPPSFSLGQQTSAALRPFESGALVGETFRVYFANFLPFLILTAVAFSPLLYFAIFPPSPGPLQTLVGFGAWFCTPIATAAVTYGVFQHLRRRDCSVGDCLRVGLSCLLPVILVAVLQALATGVAALFCLIPGIIVAMMLAVAVPVAVEERPGVLASLRRSSELTDGYRGQVFGVLLILGLLNVGLAFVLILFHGGLREASAMSTSQGYQLISQLVNLVPTGLSATASAVMYYRLRSIKESIDVEEIASVFD